MTNRESTENPAAFDTAAGIAVSARVPRYRAAHLRVQAARGHASSYPCADGCGRQAAEWSYDHSDPDELTDIVCGSLRRYSLDSDRYRPLACGCHRRFDAEQRVLREISTWNYPPTTKGTFDG